MSEPLRLTGTPASPGYAEGQVVDLDASASAYVASGSPDAEIAALDAAVGAAIERLAKLAGEADDEAAAMLEFQIAMLEDGALAAAAHEDITADSPADAAWTRALDAEIAGYEASDDEYFRARAADLRDIRDQVLRALDGSDASAAPPGAILIGDDIAPTRFLATDWSRGGGIALRRGSAASHVAMLARARGVPMLVGLGAAPVAFAGLALLDAEHGGIVLGPSAADGRAFRERAAAFAARGHAARDYASRPAATADGAEIRVLVNVADPSDVDAIDIAHCDGVGLMRTEFLFGNASGLPDEATQCAAYRKVLRWAGTKPVTIRTVDAGGDKPVADLTVEEGNPFLGLRGIRLSLARLEIFRVQIRALLRAAVHGNLKVMLPMVAAPDELERARAIFHDEAIRLDAEGIAYAMPPLGIMVEVPAAALVPEAFAAAAFFSIGSNDLTQYVMAAARDNGSVAALNDVRNPAVLRLIREVVAYGAATGTPVSLCGDAGGDPVAIPLLLAAGLRELSVARSQLGAAKAAIAACRLG